VSSSVCRAPGSSRRATRRGTQTRRAHERRARHRRAIMERRRRGVKGHRSTAPHDTPWEYAGFWSESPCGALRGGATMRRPTVPEHPRRRTRGRPVGRPGAAQAVRGRRCARAADAVVSPVSFPFPAPHPALGAGPTGS
jgi:hypothetical protein